MQQTKQPEAWGPFGLLTTVVICRSTIFYGLNTFLPLYWVAVLHQSKTVGGAALTVMLLAGALGTLLGGRMADRYSRRIVVLCSLGSLVPLLFLFVIFSPTSQLVAFGLLILIGAALFAPFSVMVVMGQEYLPNRVGTASGVTLGLAVTVGGLVAPLFGHIADLYGIHTALFTLAFVPILATLLTLTLPSRPNVSPTQRENRGQELLHQNRA